MDGCTFPIRIKQSEIWILITRKYKQRLGSITPEEARKEGFSSRKNSAASGSAFMDHGPDAQVWAYEFKVISPLYCMSEAYLRSRSQNTPGL